LICHVRGSKKRVHMTWSKDNKRLYEDGHVTIISKKKRRTVLIIQNVSKKDNGVYGCHATDPVSHQVLSMYGKLVIQGENTNRFNVTPT